MTTRISLDNVQLAAITQFSSPMPKIQSLVYSTGNTASTAGGQTVTVNGSIFNTGIVAAISNIRSPVAYTDTISSVTRISGTQIRFTTPAKAAGTYLLFLFNTDGGWASYPITYA